MKKSQLERNKWLNKRTFKSAETRTLYADDALTRNTMENPNAIKRKDQTQTGLSIRDQYSVTAQPWSFVEVILDRSNQRLPVMINHSPVSAASAETGFVSEKSMQRTDI